MCAKKNYPEISVVIPVHNYGHLLGNALDSVFAQTWNDYEVIVVDDGSVDNTADVVKSYGDRVRYIFKQNGGAASARNEGIRQARAEIIAFLDADDEWVPEKLAVQLAFWKENPQFEMIYSDMQHVDGGKKINHSYLREAGYKYYGSGWKYLDLLSECFVFTPTVLVRKRCFETVGMHDESLRTGQDLDMWLRIARRFQLGFVNEPLAIRHRHGENATRNTEMYLSNYIRIFLKNLQMVENDDESRVLHHRLSTMYINLGYYYFQQNKMTLCRDTMLQAFRFGSPKWAAMKYYVLSLMPKPLLRFAAKVFHKGPYA